MSHGKGGTTSSLTNRRTKCFRRLSPNSKQKRRMCGKLKNGCIRKSKSTNAKYGNNKTDYAFSFLAAKIAVCRADCARRSCGLVDRKKSSSLRSGIFFRQALPQSPANGQHTRQEIKMPVSHRLMYN